MMNPLIAIDYGSSRTKVARLNESGTPELVELGSEVRAVIPSVFYLPKDGGAILVGDDAVEMADSDPSGLVSGIKREIHRPGKIRCGAGRVAPERWELVAALFGYIRGRCEQEVFHRQTLDACMLTVPVCFNEAQRDKLRKAAEHAGFKTVRMLEEPVAAAKHWLSSSGRQHSDYVVVVDIGGGTTDLAALRLVGDRYEPIADLPHAGFLMGGNDIDEVIRQALVKAAPDVAEAGGDGWLVRLRRLKEQLSRDSRNLFKVNLAGQSCEVPREVVAEAVGGFVDRTKGEVSKFLDDFTELTGNRDCPILLAGGGSRMQGMKEAIESIGELAKDRVFLWNDGDYAIVKGGLLTGDTDAMAPVSLFPPAPPPLSLSEDAINRENRLVAMHQQLAAEALRLAEERSLLENDRRQYQERELSAVDGGIATDKRRAQATPGPNIALRTAWPEVFICESVGIEFVLIQPGTFVMGAPLAECLVDHHLTQHQVTLTKPFYMAKYPVTQVQWQKLMGTNPSHFKRGYVISGGLFGLGREVLQDASASPVENVSWDDCQAFCKKLCQLAKLPTGSCRLPTEAEWEYACRAGTTGPFSGTGNLSEMGWYFGNSGGITRAVGQKQPNAWGLFDMHGNVWEWCEDLHGEYAKTPLTDPTGAPQGSHRVHRGGSWNATATLARSASRNGIGPQARLNNLGCRVAITPSSSVMGLFSSRA